MANPLVNVKIQRKSRRLIDDLPYRGDLLLTDQNLLTSIVRTHNPHSIYGMLNGFFGNTEGMLDGQKNKVADIVHEGLPASFIRIRKYGDRYVPCKVRANHKVPVRIEANVPFEVTLDQNFMDSDENFLLRDQRTFGTVVSKRPGLEGTDYTLRISGIPGETFDGAYLFEMDAPVNYGYGNTQGEGSQKSNTIPTGELYYTEFFNPMVITRYKTTATGSAQADEFYTASCTALDGSKLEEFNTGVPVQLMQVALANVERQLLTSRANFDPRTGKILGRSINSQYEERPTFAGIFQQLEASARTITMSLRTNALSTLKNIERAIQHIYDSPYMTSKGKWVIMAHSLAFTKIYEAITEGGIAKSPIKFERSADSDKITIGYDLEKYVTRFGDVYLYDMGKTMQFAGQFDQMSYNGTTGNPRALEAYIFPVVVKDPKTGALDRVAKYFTKKGQSPGYPPINRGFVFGVSKGITGEVGFSGEQLSQMRDDAIQSILANSNRYRIDSLTDGTEYHTLVEGVPYFDASKVTMIRFTR